MQLNLLVVDSRRVGECALRVYTFPKDDHVKTAAGCPNPDITVGRWGGGGINQVRNLDVWHHPRRLHPQSSAQSPARHRCLCQLMKRDGPVSHSETPFTTGSDTGRDNSL